MCTWKIVDFFRPTIIVERKASISKVRQISGRKPAVRIGDHILYMVNDLQVIFGKGPGGLSIPNDAEGRAPMWKKKSIFWDLPYWKDLEVGVGI